ncbi:MAG: hypothetical protein ACKOFC_05720, partial [Solirubrobacterales bacterium]
MAALLTAAGSPSRVTTFPRRKTLQSTWLSRSRRTESAEPLSALMVVNGEEGIGPGDRYIASVLRGSGLPVVLAVNKRDRLDQRRTLAALADFAALECAGEIFPVSARTGEGVVANVLAPQVSPGRRGMGAYAASKA